MWESAPESWTPKGDQKAASWSAFPVSSGQEVPARDWYSLRAATESTAGSVLTSSSRTDAGRRWWSW